MWSHWPHTLNYQKYVVFFSQGERDLLMVGGVMPGTLDSGMLAATPAALRDRLAQKLQANE